MHSFTKLQAAKLLFTTYLASVLDQKHIERGLLTPTGLIVLGLSQKGLPFT